VVGLLLSEYRFLTIVQPTFQQDVETFSKEIEHEEGYRRDVLNRIIEGLEDDISKQVELALR
jgi:hypothetical protein